MELAVTFLDWQVVDARFATSHQPLVVEFPQLVAVAAMPVIRLVVPFVLKLDRDPLGGEGPQVLDQTVVELALPLVGEKPPNLLAAYRELGPIPPYRIFGVSEYDAVGVARVPGILGQSNLANGRFESEWRSNHGRRRSR